MPIQTSLYLHNHSLHNADTDFTSYLTPSRLAAQQPSHSFSNMIFAGVYSLHRRHMNKNNSNGKTNKTEIQNDGLREKHQTNLVQIFIKNSNQVLLCPTKFHIQTPFLFWGSMLTLQSTAHPVPPATASQSLQSDHSVCVCYTRCFRFTQAAKTVVLCSIKRLAPVIDNECFLWSSNQMTKHLLHEIRG
jgi:hypothetical protein